MPSLRERYGPKLQRVIPVGLAYVAGSLVVLQLVAYVAEMWDLSNAVGQFAFIVLLGGLVIAVVATWNRADSDAGYSGIAVGGVAAASVAIAAVLWLAVGPPGSEPSPFDGQPPPAVDTPSRVEVDPERREPESTAPERPAEDPISPARDRDATPPERPVEDSPAPARGGDAPPANTVDAKLAELARRFGAADEVTPRSGAQSPVYFFEFHEQPVQATYASTSSGVFLRILLERREIGRTERIGDRYGTVTGSFAIPSECGAIPYDVEYEVRGDEMTARASLNRDGLRTILSRTLVEGQCP